MTGTGHGGRREGAGRKPAYGEPMEPKTVTLPSHHIAYLEKLGDGNVSSGIRVLIEKEKAMDDLHIWQEDDGWYYCFAGTDKDGNISESPDIGPFDSADEARQEADAQQLVIQQTTEHERKYA